MFVRKEKGIVRDFEASATLVDMDESQKEWDNKLRL